MPSPTLLRSRAVAAAAVVLLVVAGLVAVVVRSRPPADCTVVSGDRTVALEQREAESAASAVAAVVRRRTGPAAARTAVSRAVPISAADARLVAAALTGRSPAALGCRDGGASTSEPDRLDARGLTTRAASLRRDIVATFGPIRLGGFAPGGVRSGHMAGSAHYGGRAIDAFFRPVTARNKREGWALAQYLVAHARRLAIDTVIFDGRIWTARRAPEGWRDYRVSTAGRSAATTRILEHRDHVHVDVAD
jgi:hypothetical protein